MFNKMAQLQQRPSESGGCFLYGTQILKKVYDEIIPTPIEEVYEGDYVVTVDDKSQIVLDQVVLADQNLKAKQSQVEMVRVQVGDQEIVLTHHHYIYVHQDGNNKSVLSRELKVDDVVILYDRNYGLKHAKISRISKETAKGPLKNIITLNTRNVIANSILCSVHCQGDGGEFLFSIGKFLYNYVSHKSPSIMLQVRKAVKNILNN